MNAIQEKVVNELHKPTRKNQKRGLIKVFKRFIHKPEINSGFRYILLLMNRVHLCRFHLKCGKLQQLL